MASSPEIQTQQLALDAAIKQRSTAGSLLELRIRDFAIIDDLRLTLDEGLNALTGETGAGKSILIDALGAVLGDRASPSLVRAGADRAVIEATFSRPVQLPAEIEMEPEDDVLILSREIGASRGVARINGRTVPLSLLQAAGSALVDIHGQSDHQSLLRPGTHVYFLDHFGGLDPQRLEVAALVARLRQVRQELTQLAGDGREMVRQQDLLRFQVNEIDAAELTPGEDDELAARRVVLANAEKLRALMTLAMSELDGDSQAIDAASAAAKRLADAARLDPSLAPAGECLEEAIDGLREASHTLARYVDTLEVDPDELQRVDDRLDLIRALKRKYGETIDEVLSFATSARARLGDLLGADARVEQLQAELGQLERQALQTAEGLSVARQACAAQLATAVEAQLADLGMAQAKFAARIEPRQRSADASDWSGPTSRDGRPATEPDGSTDRTAAALASVLQPTGIDEVELLLAANPGEPLRPLAQVASGGEASRLMLALKSVFSAADETPVLVFDEIEAGVGARSGHVIGAKLRQLAQHHQVLCITHLAPVAAQAGAHFRVRKIVDGERTTTAVERLQGDSRVDELAEMLAGRPAGHAARASARELLEQA